MEYRVAPGTPVRAAGGGTVGYAGSVASVRYVVVDHPNGLRTTYGRLDTVVVRVGDRVERGEVLGSVGGSFHFGVRRGQRYLDPADYLVRRDTGPRLVPLAGPARRPAHLRLTCTAAGARR